MLPALQQSGQSLSPRIAVLIPCLNEEISIAKVVNDFHTQLPQADIYVFDNASTDQTASLASKAGATVISEKRRGKGYVVQTMFQRVEADILIIVDGDDTYPAECVHALIDPILTDQADMVIGSRMMMGNKSQIKLLNLFGNLLFQNLINSIFNTNLTDILSGYRCLNRRLAKSLPLFVTGFEIEAELTVKSLERGYRLYEVPVDLRQRLRGSHSKIRLIQDGIKIFATIFALFRDYKPLTFFGSLGLASILLGLVPGFYAVLGYLETGLVLRFPSAILAVGMIIMGTLSIAIGLILHTLNRRFREMEYLLYIHTVDQKIPNLDNKN